MGHRGMGGMGTVLLFLLGCASTATRTPQAVAPTDCETLKKFFSGELDAYQTRVDGASKAYQLEQWAVETADPDGSLKRLSRLFETLQETSYDKGVLENVRITFDASKGLDPKACPFRPKIERAKGMLEASILTNPDVIRLEKGNQDRQDNLGQKSNAFRMEIPGESEPLSRALYQKKLAATADRAEREKLYRQFHSARAAKWLEWGFRDLVKSRNREAKAAGFDSYYPYRFFRAQLDYPNYRAMVKEIKEKLAPKVQRSLRKLGRREGIAKVEGWDIRYLREKSSAGEINKYLELIPEDAALGVARQFYAGLGIDIDGYHFMTDLRPRPGKNTHAFAMGVVFPHVDADLKVKAEPKPDIRFLANLRQPVKWNDVGTLVHELGHAVHMAEVRQPVAVFRGIGSIDTEAIAMTLERMAGSTEFLGDALPAVTGVAPAKIQSALGRHVAAAKLEQAITLLRQVFFSDFEHEIYANPDVDYGALWSRMHEEYWGVKVPAQYADWDIEHYVMAPVYVQNYAIGILMVEQIYASILREFKASYRSKAIGDKLRKVYFAPGQEFLYQDLTRQFTGRPLTAKAALRLLD